MINKKQYFTINEFAKLFNIHKKTLYYYDEIDLFKPDHLNQKGYRFYAHHQIYDFHVLLAFKQLNLSLKDLQHYYKNTTPIMMNELLKNKVIEIENEINRLNELKLSINTRIDIVKNSIDLDTDIIYLQHMEKSSINIINTTPVDNEMTNYLIWHNIFSKEDKHQLNENLYGQVILNKQCIENDFTPTYIFIGNDPKANDTQILIKPKGLYLVCRQKGFNLKSKDTYDKMINYIQQNNLVIIGNSYEYFLIDGCFASNPNDRMLEIQIHVDFIH